MKTDSPVARDFIESLGSKSGKYHLRREYGAIVVHTTGYDPVRRFKNDGERKKYFYTSPFDAAIRIYRSIMPQGPHYVVGQDGECLQLCQEALAAWHVGSKGADKYADRAGKPSTAWRKVEHAWWSTRWPGLLSPLELACGKLWGTERSANRGAVGIEVVPSADDPNGPWSEACWATLKALITDICARRKIPLDKLHVVSHSDAHPLDRTAKGKPWDPPPSQWSWELMESFQAKNPA